MTQTPPHDADTAPADLLVFAGIAYQPSGGWRDLLGPAPTLAAARALAATFMADHDPDHAWWHIVDAAAGRIIEHHGAQGEPEPGDAAAPRPAPVIVLVTEESVAHGVVFPSVASAEAAVTTMNRVIDDVLVMPALSAEVLELRPDAGPLVDDTDAGRSLIQTLEGLGYTRRGHGWISPRGQDLDDHVHAARDAEAHGVDRQWP